jgi:hypothetical protein
MENRPARESAHIALQIPQALDRILDLPGAPLNESARKNADEIARDQTHAMHP